MAAFLFIFRVQTPTMIFEDDILKYLYDNSPNGGVVELKDFLHEKIKERFEGDESWKNWSIPWAIAILNSLHNQDFIYFLNKDSLKIEQYGVSIREQLKITQTISVKAQLKTKGKEWNRGEKQYKVSYWANRTSIFNAIGSGIIAIIVLVIQILSYNRDVRQEHREILEQARQEQLEGIKSLEQEKTYTELRNRIRAIENSLRK